MHTVDRSPRTLIRPLTRSPVTTRSLRTTLDVCRIVLAEPCGVLAAGFVACCGRHADSRRAVHGAAAVDGCVGGCGEEEGGYGEELHD